MKNQYVQPIVEIVSVSKEDIMIGSDTFVDVGGLWTEGEN